MIPAPRPKFSSPIWIEEIQRNKIFNKQRSVCNDKNNDIPLADDDEPQIPLTNGAIFLTEPPHCNGNAGDVTPRRTRVRFPVRSISEILEFEDDDEVKPATANGVGNTIADGIFSNSESHGVSSPEKSPSSNGSRGGLRFLQTDI